MKVAKMEWKDLEMLVKRRLNKLAMCKRGVISTEINKKRQELGDRPRYTQAEIKQAHRKKASDIKKALTPTLAEVKKYEGDLYQLRQMLATRAKKVVSAAIEHPKAKAWDTKMKNLERQEAERIATLDGEIQDIEDQFVLQILDIEDFRKKEEELEAKVW